MVVSALVPPWAVEILRPESLVADAAPPYVPSLNPSALKLVFPFVPLATLNVELA
jgi:hypothetical protein